MNHDPLRDRYIRLLQQCLTRELFIDEEPHRIRLAETPAEFGELVRSRDWELVTLGGDAAARAEGRDWPPFAETMIGTARLDNVVACVTDVIARDIPGDLIEAGTWRGGTTILMRGVLEAFGVTDRTVWVADSFQGLPAPDADRYPADSGKDLSHVKLLAADSDTVRANFARYGLLDDHVRFLEGWFCDTLPDAPIDHLAVLRLDGDLYESTWDSLVALYPKLSPGGYAIVDDYFGWDSCQKAVDDYRAANDIDDPIVQIDWTGTYWQRHRE